MEKRLLIANDVSLALINEWRNVSQQLLMFLEVFKKDNKSLASFRKCLTEYYFFRTLCPTGLEKLFAALEVLSFLNNERHNTVL